MQKKLQQLKRFFSEDPLFFFCVLLIVFLPIYSGQIVANSQAFILGKYINYLHVRISLHFLVGLALSIIYFKNKENKNALLFFLSTFLVSIALSIAPISELTKSLGKSFFPLFFSSGFHLFEFLLSTVSIIIATGNILSASASKKHLALIAICTSIALQLILGLIQFALKGPFLPSLLSWTGQPLVFTSKSIIGIFEYARVYGTTPHPNILAGILAYYGFLILSITESRLFQKAILIILILLIAGTMSKSGLIGVTAVIILYFIRKLLKNISLRTSHVLLLIVGALSLFLVGFYFVSFPNISATFVESRTVIERLYLELLRINPLYLLSGTGFTMAIPTLLSQSHLLGTNIIWGNQILAEPPHNILLLSFVELGIPAVLLYLYSVKQLVTSTISKLEPWQLISITTLVIILGGLDHYLIY